MALVYFIILDHLSDLLGDPPIAMVLVRCRLTSSSQELLGIS